MPVMPDGLQEALVAVLTWVTTGIGRSIFPDFWERLDSEKIRLAVVAFVAVCLSVATGITQGLGVWPIMQLAVSALAGSVLLRRVTKGGKNSLEFQAAKRNLRKDRGIRTGGTVSTGTKP